MATASEIYEQRAETLRGLLGAHFNQLEGSVHVNYRPPHQCPYIFAAHAGKAGVMIYTSLWFDQAGFNRKFQRMALAALEIRNGITSAVEVRETHISEETINA
jgi:hypothetical protein